MSSSSRVAAAVAIVAFAAGTVRAQQPVFVPLHASGIYTVGERVGWTVTLPHGAANPANRYTYVITKNRKDTVRAGVLDLTSGAATLDAVFDEPAMMYVQVRDREGDAQRPINLGAAIAPTQIAPSVPRPADFDAFWTTKLQELARIPIDPILSPVETSVPDIELYTARLQSLGSTVQGYLAKPKRAGKFPALVIFQYAGVYPLQQQWATTRAAEGWLTLNVDSHDVAPDRVTGVPTNYQAVGDTSRETSYFLAMYLRDTRAIDYIATRPDWDGRVIAVTGTSMGGQQSLATAGLNPKVTAVVVNEPSGADANGELHGRAAGYPSWQWHDPRVVAASRYFDTVNFASRIMAPTCIAVGFIDTVAPPVGIIAAFNQIPGAKELIPMIESDHNNLTPDKQGAWTARSREILDQIRTRGTFVPRPL